MGPTWATPKAFRGDRDEKKCLSGVVLMARIEGNGGGSAGGCGGQQ